MSTPVYADGSIYGFSIKKKGQFVALDAATGALRWATEGREGEHASVLLTAQHLIYLTNGADLVFASRAAARGGANVPGNNAAAGNAGFSVEKRYEVADSQTWAVPVLLGSDLLVRDPTGLIRLTPGS